MDIDAARRRIAHRHYVLAAVIVLVGIADVASGTPEGVYIVAAGAVIAILARAIELGVAPSGRAPRWVLVVVLVLAVGALIWAATEWHPADGIPGRSAHAARS